MFREFWMWYGRQIKGRPIITKSITGAVITAVGDLSCQAIERCNYIYIYIYIVLKIKPANTPIAWGRTLRFTGISLFALMPYFHFYTVRFLPKYFPVTNLKTLIIRVLFDQSLNSPMIITFFFLLIPVLEGKSLRESKKKLKEGFWATLKANWCYWPFVQLINFRFVPVPYQVLFTNFAALIWNAIFSFMIFTYKSTSSEDK